VALALALALAAPAAQAEVHSLRVPLQGDRASAAALVAAESQLAAAWLTREAAVVAAERHYVDGLSSGCGPMLEHAPIPYTAKLRDTVDMLAVAGNGGFEAAALDAVGPAVRSFAEQVARLRWSQPAIAARFARSLAAMRRFAAAPVPDICAATRTSAAAHFAMVPASMRAYGRLYDAYTRAEREMPYAYAMRALGGSDGVAVRRLTELKGALGSERGEAAQLDRLTAVLPLAV
jgi:hypothetical protein